MSAPENPVIGVGVVVFRGDDVLLIRRGEEPNKGLWTIPGGRQEIGETVRETAVREILEETGVTIEGLTLVDVVDLLRRNDDGSLLRHYTLVDFRADWVSGEPRPGGDADACAWVPASEIASHVVWEETIRIVREAALKGSRD